jgi:hypothetical protein
VKKKIARVNTIARERELGIGLKNGNEKKS